MYNLGSAFWCQVIALLSCFCSSWHKELSGLAPRRAMSIRAIVQRSAAVKAKLLHPQLLRSAFIDGDGGSQPSGWEQGGEGPRSGIRPTNVRENIKARPQLCHGCTPIPIIPACLCIQSLTTNMLCCHAAVSSFKPASE